MSPLPKKTIIVIDDELEITNAVKSILEDENFKIFTATDGVEAIRLLSNQRYDLILMDIMMPKMSGYDVIKDLQKTEINLKTPVILMSCAKPQVKQSEYKWKYFLKKPFTIDELLGTVKRFINSS